MGVDSSVTPAMFEEIFSGDTRFQRLSRLSDDEILPCYRFKGRIAVDFFRLFDEGDTLWYGLNVVWTNRPISPPPLRIPRGRLAGIPMRIPDAAERYLTECYGEGMANAEPLFCRLGIAKIHGGFPPVCRCVAYANIFKAAWRGDLVRAHDLCDQALVLDPDDRLVVAIFDLPALWDCYVCTAAKIDPACA